MGINRGIFLCIGTFVLLSTSPLNAKRIPRDEVRLLHDLFKEEAYDTAARPIVNQSEAVHVTLGMSLAQIIDMDEKNQIITLNGFFRFYWVDPYLVWDPAEYGGIDHIRVPWDRIWYPDVALYSSLDSDRRATELFTGSNAGIRHDGKVEWLAPAVLQSSCKVNVEYFPFDQQKCYLKFGSWTHDGHAMDLVAQGDSASLDLFVTHEQWTLNSATLGRRKNYYPCCPGVPYYDIMLTITITRKPMFAMFYYVLPSLLLLAIGNLVFFLPAESGEKVSMGMTVLLSITVYQLLLSDIVPRTSEVVPVLGKFVGGAVFFLSFSTMVAVVLVNIHFRGDRGQKVPEWLKKLVLVWIAKLVCVRNDVRIMNGAQATTKNNKAYDSKDSVWWAEDSLPSTDLMKSNFENFCATDADGETQTTSLIKKAEPETDGSPSIDDEKNQAIRHAIERLAEQVQVVKEGWERRQEEADELERTKAEWDAISFVLDRGFLYLLCIMIVSLCLVVFIARPDYD